MGCPHAALEILMSPKAATASFAHCRVVNVTKAVPYVYVCVCVCVCVCRYMYMYLNIYVYT